MSVTRSSTNLNITMYISFKFFDFAKIEVYFNQKTLINELIKSVPPENANIENLYDRNYKLTGFLVECGIFVEPIFHNMSS